MNQAISYLNQRKFSPWKLTSLEPWLLWSALFLALTGLVMVYSASIAIAENTYASANYFLIRHAIHLSIAFIAACLILQIKISTWRTLSPWLFIGGIILLCVVLIPFIGHTANGATRWISFQFFYLQPSEFMKLFVVLYAADYTCRKQKDMEYLKRGFLPLASVIILTGFLLLQQPDFGAFMVICAIAFGILFLGGIRVSIFVMLSTVATLSFALLSWLSPYRRERLLGFMNPWEDPFGTGYQLTHSLIAFGRGEWFGVGLGGSIEKLFYLPEAHTDFLLAVLAEEFGLFGILVIIFLFGILIHRAFHIGRQASSIRADFQSLVAQGIALWFGIQFFIASGVNVGLLPTKGITLPLMSYGGSSLLANIIAIAILLRIDFENKSMLRQGSSGKYGKRRMQ